MPSDYLSDVYLSDYRDADELQASLVQKHETFYSCVQVKLCHD